MTKSLDKEIQDLQKREERRLFWLSKDRYNVHEWKPKRMEDYLNSIMERGNFESTEKFDYPFMEDYKRHSFTKATRLSLMNFARLIFIRQRTGKEFKELVLEMIEREYEKAKKLP